ncbi:UDP-glucuronosyltransferase 2A2-like [Babylonia areolata]|uniref:UDP-glucuronosyltransferase 2A2-like n=1 Tax=Babylonia areolata TaxID=304850 RepID=UPI003FD66195
MPWPVTSYPNPISHLPGRMNFGQRLVNTMMFSLTEMMTHVIGSLYDQGDDFGEDLEGFDYGAAMKKAVLYLENSDYILDYAKATFPNFVQVGGLTTGPAKSMPEDLQKYFDSSPDGVVVISMGSMLYNASQSITDKLLSATAKVRMNVVLRLSVDRATVPVPKHVKIVSWFPQNDALGHANTRLFVSHCGKNGFFEGLYHGVPILCTPLNADGYGTAKRVADFGVGGSADLKTITAEELGATINGLVEDPKVGDSMKFYSILFHERPETPAHRAVSALEHVIKHGGEHLKPQTEDLNFVQYIGLDVFCVLILGVLAVPTLLVWGCSVTVRHLVKCRAARSEGSADKGTKQQ